MKWAESDLATLIELYPNCTADEVGKRVGRSASAVQIKAAKMGLKKAPDFYENLHKTLNNKGTFKKGHTTWNKNMKGLRTGGDAGFFKKGHTPHTTKENGTITVRYDEHGRIWLAIKVENNKWVRYSHYVFAQYYGEVPKGMCIRHRNDNHLDFRLENLECITKAENQRRNSASLMLTDGFVARTMISRGLDKTEKEQLKEAYMAQSELIELKRNLLKLKRLCKTT